MPTRLIALVALVLFASPGGARTLTDSAGRVVEVPDRVERVFAAGPPAAVLVYAIRPEALLGWPRALRDSERPYIAEPYRDLPETGRLTGRGGDANIERVLAMKPDLIIDFGSVRDTYVSLADRVQAQTGIPYLLIDGRLDATAEALRLAGDAMGVPEQGEKLARYAESLFERLDDLLERIPQEERPRVYLARGPDGLETGLRGSINTEIIERAGGRNVAYTEDGRKGLIRTSMEQVIVAAPDTIITWDARFYESVWSNPYWAGVPAVREDRVYLSPTGPFGWIDRPPSINRLMGLEWLAGMFYPDHWPGKLEEEVREFYRLYYHVEPKGADMERLIRWSQGHKPW